MLVVSRVLFTRVLVCYLLFEYYITCVDFVLQEICLEGGPRPGYRIIYGNASACER